MELPILDNGSLSGEERVWQSGQEEGGLRKESGGGQG